jgi:hypothetical protein
MYGGNVKIIKLNTQKLEKTGYTEKDTLRHIKGHES